MKPLREILFNVPPTNYIKKENEKFNVIYSIFFPDRLFKMMEVRQYVSDSMYFEVKYDIDEMIGNTFSRVFEQINQLWNFKGELDEYKRGQYDRIN